MISVLSPMFLYYTTFILNYLLIKILYCIIFVFFFLPSASYQGDCAMGKRKYETFYRLLDTNSKRPKRTLIPRDQKYLCGPLVRVRTYGGQEINGNFTQVCLTVGIVGSLYSLLSYFPFLEYITIRVILSKWQSPHTDGDMKSTLYPSNYLYLPF